MRNNYNDELIIVRDRDEARRLGMKDAEYSHITDKTIKFWWPALGREALLGRSFKRVTADRGVIRLMEHNDYVGLRCHLEMRNPNFIWMDF